MNNAAEGEGGLRHEQPVGDVVGQRGLAAGDFDGDCAGLVAVGDDLALGFQAEARFGEVAEEFGRLLDDADDAEPLAGGDLRQTLAGGARDRAVGFGDWVAVRIGGGVAEEGVDTVHEQIADSVLHVFGFFVDFVPSQLKRASQEQFDQPVAAEDAEGEHAAGVGEASAFVGHVLGEAAFAERFEHAGDGAGRDAESFGELAGRCGLPLLAGGNLVDCLDVVFDGQAGHEDTPAVRVL